MSTDDILDQIDHAIRDSEVGPDAMRWTPQDQEERLVAPRWELNQVDIDRWTTFWREAFDTGQIFVWYDGIPRELSYLPGMVAGSRGEAQVRRSQEMWGYELRVLEGLLAGPGVEEEGTEAEG